MMMPPPPPPYRPLGTILPPRPPGPSLRASLTLIGIGFAIVVASVVAIALPLIGTFTSTVYTVADNAEVHLQLHHARYTIYQRTGTTSGFGSVTSEHVERLFPTSVLVVAPDQSNVPVLIDDNTESITRGHVVYTGSLVFSAPAGGEYRLVFSSASPTRVIVARSLPDALRSVWGWFVTAALGAGLVVAGVVMWIVGATRRGRAKRAAFTPWDYATWAPPPPPPPPG